MSPTVYFICVDNTDNTNGGTKQIYRQIEILNDLGLNAYAVHFVEGFKCTWFDHNVPVKYLHDVKLNPDDSVVVSDLAQMWPSFEGIENAKKIIYNQGFWMTFKGFGGIMQRIKAAYSQEADAVLASSEYTADFLTWLFPKADIHHTPYSFDRHPIAYQEAKKKQLCYMTRRREDELKKAMAMLGSVGAFEGWDLVPIDGMSESEVIKTMQESALFFCFSHKDGFGMPPCEAMACGCPVVGFHGVGGKEFFGHDFAVAANEDDTLDFVMKAEEFLAMDLSRLNSLGREASDYIQEKYSSRREVHMVRKAWSEIYKDKEREALSARFTTKPALRIKTIILHHNKPANADRLYDELSTAFDDVEILDSGSDPTLIPINVTMLYDNIYWTGAWNEAIKKFSDYDVIWILGCDVELKDDPIKYRESIERNFPFGCWSPAIEGRCHPFMSHENYHGEAKSVVNIEGMALAISGELAKDVGQLIEGSDIGFGQDYWMCYRSREAGMRNIIDGDVVVIHPEGIGYNEQEAHDQMERAFTDAFGADFRKTIFNYSPDFRGNLLDEVSTVEDNRIVLTVDKNGNIGEFSFFISQLEGFSGIILEKGPAVPVKLDDIEIVRYTDEAFEDALSKAHVALFTYCDDELGEYVKKIQAAGIPVVMNNTFAGGLIDHEKNGAVYGHSTWAMSWLKNYGLEGEERDRVLGHMNAVPKVDMILETTALPDEKPKVLSLKPPVASIVSLDPDPESESETQVEQPSVTVITPTYKRDVDVIRRAIQCVQAQTYTDWEQVICSDGIREDHVESLVGEFSDLPITYTHTESRTDGDYGNTVRAEMLAKAKGDYIVLLDDDNMIMPEYMTKMVNAIKSADVDFAICRVLHFGPLQPHVGTPPVVLTGIPPKLYYFDTLQMVCKREALQDAGWDRESGYFADGVTVERLVEKGYKYVEVPETLAIHM